VTAVQTSAPNPLLNKLSGGDRRSIGQANQVAGLILRRPALFPQLIEGLSNSDPLIRMRAADAAEKVTLRRPDLLKPFKARLLHLLDEATQRELRWHLAMACMALVFTIELLSSR